MVAVSVSINRGFDGEKLSDFTAGTSAPGVGDIELRVNLADISGGVVTRKDVYIACKAFQRWFDSFPTNQTNLPVL